MNIKEKVTNIIIDSINVNASGRLIISKVEDHDKDLKIEKRADYITSPIFVKFFFGGSISGRDISKEISQAHIADDDQLYFVSASFNFIKQDLEDTMFIVPSKEVEKLKDIDFSKFLVSKKDLGSFFINVLDKK